MDDFFFSYQVETLFWSSLGIFIVLSLIVLGLHVIKIKASYIVSSEKMAEPPMKEQW